MEGSYNKILIARNEVPHPLMTFFVDVLVQTVRDKLSECAEKAYESFPVSDAMSLLTFKSAADLKAYATKRGWQITSTDNIIFPGHASAAAAAAAAGSTGASAGASAAAAAAAAAKQKALEIPSLILIKQTLGYATELERIV